MDLNHACLPFHHDRKLVVREEGLEPSRPLRDTRVRVCQFRHTRTTLVLERGLEPLRSIEHSDLNAARLPITPFEQNLESERRIELLYDGLCRPAPYRLGYSLMVRVKGVEPSLNRS